MELPSAQTVLPEVAPITLLVLVCWEMFLWLLILGPHVLCVVSFCFSFGLVAGVWDGCSHISKIRMFERGGKKALPAHIRAGAN